MKKIFTIVSALAFILSFASCQKDSSSDGPGDDEEIIKLDIPSGLKLAEYGDESIKMAWEPVDKAQYYTYKVIAKVIENEEAVDSVVLMGKTFNTYKTIVKLDSICVKNGYNYWFTVAAGAGKRSASKYCEYVRCEPGGLTPLVPEGVTMTQYTDNGLTYKWDAAEEAEYYSYQLTNPKGEVIKKGDTKDLTVTLDGLKKGRYYYFAVAGANPNKTSAFSKKVEGLTFGEYIPALTFNATMADENFSFVEGTELTITDGTYTAGYVVKSSGKTTTLELTTEEEVQYNQPKYTAMMPLALTENGVISADIAKAEDGTFAGVPCWAESDGTDMVFHSYMKVLKYKISTEKTVTIDKISLKANKPLSGTVVSATTGDAAMLTFAGGDNSIDYTFPEPIKIVATKAGGNGELEIPILNGDYDVVCALLMNEGTIVSSVVSENIAVSEKQDIPVQEQSLMIVEEVQFSDVSVPENAVMGYASVVTGTSADYDYGFLTTSYAENNWITAEFIPGKIDSESGKTFTFSCDLSKFETGYLAPCVKPKSAPNVAASVGKKSFYFNLDFGNPDMELIPADDESAKKVGLAANGMEFPTQDHYIECAYNTTGFPTQFVPSPFTLNGYPFIAGTNAMASSLKGTKRIYWDQAAGTFLTNKMRCQLKPKGTLPSNYAPYYFYWSAKTGKKYFVGTSSSASSAKYGNDTATVLEYKVTADKIPANAATIYFGCDSNNEDTKRFVFWFIEQ